MTLVNLNMFWMLTCYQFWLEEAVKAALDHIYKIKEKNEALLLHDNKKLV